ncbi:FMN phosphatase YigB, HAD superfamily [Daejeonella rubra]|uniref:FMN phosphatase YigB, HAD superfamily n=1 Tax=Daejeonella rubra TaxID=990371 RepID=A0A1G9UFQ6_9SPHI|nr:HAD hydrolase-like protein [Daejeonella rubra]SDM58746.1 FMN phosphatase YigB, HAD superfamily [Daejeonella rubra]
MLKYKDLDSRKKAFVFELDDVLYPERDYLLQVYYLFSNFIEFTEGFPQATDLTEFFKKAYLHHGDEAIFDRVKEAFGINEKYRDNFDRLYHTARLPLKLLLFSNMLTLLQEIVVDRKEIFIVTNGKPEIQINKIMQTEWNGLENYLKVYYAREINQKPEPDVLSYILKEHNLLRQDLFIIGATETDKEFAASGGVDYLNISEFM